MLTAGYHTHKSSTEFICMDSDPETPGDVKDENGKLFYLVKAKCGTDQSLVCDPNGYNTQNALNCVVCAK